MRGKLEEARERLERLRKELVVAEDALANRLVELYKADEPDALTVILQADGFADLLEQTEFLERISEQDQAIIERVRVLKAEAKKQEELLAELEQRVEDAANAILAQRNELAARRRTSSSSSQDELAARARRPPRRPAQVHDSRVRARGRPARARGRAGARDRTSSRRRRARRRFSRAPGSSIWPVSGPVVSRLRDALGPAARGHRHRRAGRAPPIRAADSGTVVLLGWTGGYGNYTCIQHTRQPVHVLRAPVELRDLERRVRLAGPGDRLRRLHRPLLRRPPALRDARQRVAGRPDGLPVARLASGRRLQPEIQIGPLELQDVRALLRRRLHRRRGRPRAAPEGARQARRTGRTRSSSRASSAASSGRALDYVIQNWDDVSDDLLGNLFSGSGLVWFGGLVGGAVGVVPVGMAARLPRASSCSTSARCRSRSATRSAASAASSRATATTASSPTCRGRWPIPTGRCRRPTRCTRRRSTRASRWASSRWRLWRLRGRLRARRACSRSTSSLAGLERLLVEFIRRNDDVALGLTLAAARERGADRGRRRMACAKSRAPGGNAPGGLKSFTRRADGSRWGTTLAMRATKAYIASLGTTGLLLAFAASLLLLVGTLFAFDAWPGADIRDAVDSVLVDDDDEPCASPAPSRSRSTLRPAALAVASGPAGAGAARLRRRRPRRPGRYRRRWRHESPRRLARRRPRRRWRHPVAGRHSGRRWRSAPADPVGRHRPGHEPARRRHRADHEQRRQHGRPGQPEPRQHRDRDRRVAVRHRPRPSRR